VAGQEGRDERREYDALLEDKITPIFERLKADCAARKILTPRVVYGYFPCNSDGDDLVVWDPASINFVAPFRAPRELERFTFPRQSDKRRLCISDFFPPMIPARSMSSACTA
jgi:5-methyltetrahydrofolate--homocysteine methyltransferase